MKMDMALDVISSTDRELVISGSSQVGGAGAAVFIFFLLLSPPLTTFHAVHIVLALTSSLPNDSNLAKYFHNAASLKAMPGFLEIQSFHIPVRGSIEVVFSGLKPQRSYTIIAALNYWPVEGKLRSREPAESILNKAPWSLEESTAAEVLEIGWKQLTTSMKITELRAAIRCEYVQVRALNHHPVVRLPLEEELNTADVFAVLETGSGAAALARHVSLFVDWWAGLEPQTSKIRGEFLFIESVHASLDSDLSNVFVQQGFCTIEELQLLQTFADSKVKQIATAVEYGRHVMVESNSTSEEEESVARKTFFTFRSWYKGGQVIADFEEAEKLRVRALMNSGVALNDSDGSASSNDIEGMDENDSMASMADQRLTDRNAFVEKLVAAMDSSSSQVQRLYDGYYFAQKKGLKQSDLIMGRGNLSNTDVASIMCTKKLMGLLVDRKLIAPKDGERYKDPSSPLLVLTSIDPNKCFARPKSIEGAATKSHQAVKPSKTTAPPVFAVSLILQRIANVDIFRAVDPQLLKADDPPPVTITPLPGTERRPLKPWQLLSAADRRLELSLACSFVRVEELAVQDGIEIPDPEDFNLPADTFTSKANICKLFQEWYSGDEDVNLVPGLGVPTLQRVIFAEDFESKYAEGDPSTLTSMIDKNMPLPKRYHVNNDDDDTPSNTMEDFETLLHAYQKAIDTSAGFFLRSDMIKKALTRVLLARRMSTVKFLWPPGMNRIGLQYLFPRMGVLIPRFSLPQRRVVLFPSRGRESNNFDEVMAWYSPQELDADDVALGKAERQGAKMRAYHEWLAHEEERVEESRTMMEDEDAAAQDQRATLLYLEEQWKVQEQRLLELDEQLDSNDPDSPSMSNMLQTLSPASRSNHRDGQSMKRFRFLGSLPQEYWYIFEESFEYKHGSGIYNEDELEDMRLEQAAIAKKAVEDAQNFERYLNEEKKKRDTDEAQRQKREEQDRRLKEGVVRRRQLREHFDEMKRQRIAKEAEDKLAMERMAEEERLELLAIEEEEREILEREQEESSRQTETKMMHAEEMLMRDYKIAAKEVRFMEHEDIHSFLVEQLQLKLEAQRQAHLRELEELYRPFVPFHFKKSRIRLPALHDILREDEDEDDMLELDHDVGQSEAHSSLHSGSSRFLILQEHETASSHAHLSKRYEQIYGSEKDGSTVLKHQQQQLSQPSLGNTRSMSIGSNKRVSTPPPLDRLEVRAKDHTPSKRTLRRLSTSAKSFLPFNPYETQWELMARPVSPALLSSTPYFSRPSLHGRSLHSSPPLKKALSLQPLPHPMSFLQKSEEVPLQMGTHSLLSVDSAQLDPEMRDQLVESVLKEPPLDERDPALLASVSWSKSLQEVSLFHSLVAAQQASPEDLKARRRLKALLTSSAAAIEQSEQKAYLDYIHEQRKLAFASLTTLDRSKPKPKASSLPHLEPIASRSARDSNPSAKAAQNLLDFKTRKLAQSASESVLRMQHDREALRQYVSGQAVFEGDDYLLACEPGVRERTVLEASPIAYQFALQIEKQLEQQEREEAGGGKASALAPAPSASSAPVNARSKTKRKAATAETAGAEQQRTLPAADGQIKLGAIMGSSMAVPVLAAKEVKRTVLQRPAPPQVMVSKPKAKPQPHLQEQSTTSDDVKDLKSMRHTKSVDLFIQTPRSSVLIESPDSPMSSVAGSSIKRKESFVSLRTAHG